MAQAARLNLRMQKELKLLLADPPPGASFPSLSDGCSSAFLTSIDALLQGPEGSVYANGMFKIRIQIPERYPFQPPIVTFSTPIYHPNIDNGGRICLDILNLPPKGTWQPSLNISTVLTSIGLLLNEPNPDDGLMHDASREYKYNRQTFDQNARSMTEKYAGATNDSAMNNQSDQAQTSPSTAQTKTEESSAHIREADDVVHHPGFYRSTKKLSLEVPGSSSDTTTPILNEAYNISSQHAGMLGAARNKLSLKLSIDPPRRNDETTNTTESVKHCSSSKIPYRVPLAFSTIAGNEHDCTERSHCTAISQDHQSASSVKTSQSDDSNDKLQVMANGGHPSEPVNTLPQCLYPSHNVKTGSKECSLNSTRLKKPGSIRSILSSGLPGHPQQLLGSEKENEPPVHCFNQSAGRTVKRLNESARKLSETNAEALLRPVVKLKERNENIILQSVNASCHSEYRAESVEKQKNDQWYKQHNDSQVTAEAVIVLDSESSDDENVPMMRSKLSLGKRFLSGKRKSSFR